MTESKTLVGSSDQKRVTDNTIAAPVIASSAALSAEKSPDKGTSSPVKPAETTPDKSDSPATDSGAEAKSSATNDNTSDAGSSKAVTTSLIAATGIAATQDPTAGKTTSSSGNALDTPEPIDPIEASEAHPPNSSTNDPYKADSLDSTPPQANRNQASASITPQEAAAGDTFAEFKADYVRRCNLLVQSKVVYPRRAIDRNQEGKVSIDLVVDRNGKLVDMKVAEDPGHKLLVRAAMRAIKKVKALPPLPADFPEEQLELTIPFVFKLP